MIIYGMYNKEQYLEAIKVIKEDLKRMVLKLNDYNNAMELQDQIEYVINNMLNDYFNYSNDLPNSFFEINSDFIKFNFVTYYHEFDDFYNNIVIISRDWKNITLIYEYENMAFTQTYSLENKMVNSCKVEINHPVIKSYSIK